MSNGAKLVTQWTCDKCQVEAFNTYEEAAAHDKTCDGKGPELPSGATPLQVALASAPKQAKIEAEFKVERKIPNDSSTSATASLLPTKADPKATAAALATTAVTETAAVTDTHAESPLVDLTLDEDEDQGVPKGMEDQLKYQSHPKSALDGKEQAMTGTKEEGDQEGTDTVTVWTCDVCRVAEYSTFEEAAAHEKACRLGQKSLNARSLGATTKPQAPVLISAQDSGPIIPVESQGEPPIAAAPSLSLNAPASLAASEGQDGKEVLDPKSILRQSLPVLYTAKTEKPWTCGSCWVAEFKTLEEASEHERACCEKKRKIKRAFVEIPHDHPLNKPARAVAAREGTGLGDNEDGFSRLVWQCDLCGIAEFETEEQATKHELTCAGKSKRQGDGLNARKDDAKPSSSDAAVKIQKGKGQVTLTKLRNSAIDENGVDPSARPIAAASKRQRIREKENTKEKKSRDQDGDVYFVPPSGGVPLLSSQSAAMASKLSEFHQLCINNLELCADARDTFSTATLRIRCQHCKSNSFPTVSREIVNVSSWYKIVKKISSNHVLKCPCIGQHVRTQLETAHKSKKDQSALPLKAYCDFLAAIYNMKDSEKGVIWGDWGKDMPFITDYCGKPCDQSVAYMSAVAKETNLVTRQILMERENSHE